MTKKLRLSALALLVLTACSQKVANRPALDRGLIEKLDVYVTKVAEQRRVPGLAVAVVRSGHEAAFFTKGVLKSDGKADAVPVNSETLFPIGSTTKAFTAMLAAKFSDRGLIDFHDPVKKVFPAFELSDLEATQNATWIDLMSHQTGMGRYDFAWIGSTISPAEMFSRVKCLPFVTKFRGGYRYNNFMYLAAGLALESADLQHRPWSKIVDDEIFKPLGMNATVPTFAQAESVTNRAWPHVAGQPVTTVSLDVMAAAGGIHSSISDMSKWVQALLDQGRGSEQMVSAGVFADLIAPHVKFFDDRPPPFISSGYGLGWNLVNMNGHKIVTHDGGVIGGVANVSFVPEEGWGVVVLANDAGAVSPQSVAFDIYETLAGDEPMNLALAETPTPENIAPPATDSYAGDLHEFEGQFTHPGFATTMEVTVEPAQSGVPESLQVRDLEFSDLTLPYVHVVGSEMEFAVPVPLNPGTIPLSRVRFARGPDGKVNRMYWQMEDGGPELEWTRKSGG